MAETSILRHRLTQKIGLVLIVSPLILNGCARHTPDTTSHTTETHSGTHSDSGSHTTGGTYRGGGIIFVPGGLFSGGGGGTSTGIGTGIGANPGVVATPGGTTVPRGSSGVTSSGTTRGGFGGVGHTFSGSSS